MFFWAFLGLFVFLFGVDAVSPIVTGDFIAPWNSVRAVADRLSQLDWSASGALTISDFSVNQSDPFAVESV